MAAAQHKGDLTFTGAVDLSDATVTMPTAALTDEDNVVWTGTHEFDSTVAFDGAVDADSTFNIIGGTLMRRARVLAADAALTLAATDAFVELNITTGTTVATMTVTEGQEVTVSAGVRSGGSYTLACTRGATAGNVTLDAVGEGATLVCLSGVWRLQMLHGGATFA